MVDRARTTTPPRRLVTTDRGTTVNPAPAIAVLAPTDPGALANMDQVTMARPALEPTARTPTARGPLVAMTRVLMAGLAPITTAQALQVAMEVALPVVMGLTNMEPSRVLEITAQAPLVAMEVALPVATDRTNMGPDLGLETTARAPLVPPLVAMEEALPVPVAMDRDRTSMARALILMVPRALEEVMLQAVAATLAVELANKLGDPIDMIPETRWAARAWSRRPNTPSGTSGERPGAAALKFRKSVLHKG